MVLYAVLAASSRHRALLMEQPEDEASFYHGQCLRLVIDALSSSERHDDNLLASVVLLRVYEEIEQSTDTHLHLQGMGRLMSTIPGFAHSGGLAEACCWMFLRQDIFVSVVTCQPPTSCLENYDRSEAFKFRDDGACANVIVLLFAKVLRLVHSANQDGDNEHWLVLESDVERWNERRQMLFQPVYEEDLDLDEDRPFPVICMINGPQGSASSSSHSQYRC